METSPEIQTGLAFEIPIGHVLLIFSRSGHGFRETIRLANCVGIVDSDYRGEVLVKLVKDQAEGAVNGCVIRPGDRVAQGMVIPIPKIEFEVVDNLNVTVRGADGFGSTGR
jgi:dUTP pyrophosphatase